MPIAQRQAKRIHLIQYIIRWWSAVYKTFCPLTTSPVIIIFNRESRDAKSEEWSINPPLYISRSSQTAT